MVDSVELMKFAHSRHTAKSCPVVDVKKEKKRLSLRFLYHEMPQGVPESRKHDSDFKVGRPVLGHREVRTEAF